MIATASQRTTSDANERFVTMLPDILRVIRQRLRTQPRRDREELAAEAVANAFTLYVSLVRRGKQDLAFPTPLATFGCRQAIDGRLGGRRGNIKDVTSRSCQRQKGISVTPLRHYDRRDGEWKEIVVEDRHAGPADIACCRLDFEAWLSGLPHRERKIAETLAMGESTGRAAKMFRVSSARISQIRRELHDAWRQFQGEDSVVDQAAGATC